MEWAEHNEMREWEGERRCQQCNEIKLPIAFAPGRGKTGERKKICCACELSNQQKRYQRVAAQRETWQRRQEWEACRHQTWERKAALRQEHEERWREREAWYLQQPDRPCRACHQVLPATAFGGISSANGFILYTRCKICHEALREHRQLACCLCQKKAPHTRFISHYNGYALSGDGTWIALCCRECEAAFSELSNIHQYMYIQACCLRTFPTGQVIYAEVDPETGEIRYVGRTSNPRRRHVQHLVDASPIAGQWGKERKVWYTRANWIHALSENGLTPFMRILQPVEVSPLVVEWEQRYIWHGMQQGWPLLNVETMDERLVARVKAMQFNFLTVPFEMLVEQHFFTSYGIVALLHKWYGTERFID